MWPSQKKTLSQPLIFWSSTENVSVGDGGERSSFAADQPGAGDGFIFGRVSAKHQLGQRIRHGGWRPPANAAQIRERETARFALRDETTLLVEATAVLQDLGFTIEESAPRLGVLAGAKDRDATEVGQVAGQIAMTVGLALLGVRYNPVWDKDQLIRVTLTTLPLRSEGAVQMRVSFERIVINTQGLARAERLIAPEFSSGFFEQVRKGLASRGIRA